MAYIQLSERLEPWLRKPLQKVVYWAVTAVEKMKYKREAQMCFAAKSQCL